MKKLLSLCLCLLMLVALPASVAGEASTFWKTVPGGFRAGQCSGELAITEAGDPVTHTFTNFGSGTIGNISDYVEIYYKATTGTNALHVQLFKASGDSTHHAPSTVYYVYPDQVLPIPIKGISSVKINLTETDEVGVAVVYYYKL